MTGERPPFAAWSPFADRPVSGVGHPAAEPGSVGHKANLPGMGTLWPNVGVPTLESRS
jgi:hypothetical protein